MDEEHDKEQYFLTEDEKRMLSGMTSAGKCGFAINLKHLQTHGFFPRSLTEVKPALSATVCESLGIAAVELKHYDFTGRTARLHRDDIRARYGYRYGTNADTENCTAYLADKYQFSSSADDLYDYMRQWYREHSV